MAISVKQKAKIAAWALVAGVVATAPVGVSASNANDTKSTSITANVAATISMTTGATVTMNVTPTGSGAASSSSDTVTVNTNNSSGYALTFSNNDATTSLSGPNANTIAAHTGTLASPTTLANNSWGYRVVSAGGFGATATSAQTNVADLSATWAGVPALASPATIKTTATTATNDVTTFWYGIKADTSKPSGAYTDSVTYTATANN